MGKFLVRITTIIVSIYLLLCCYFAQFHGIDLLDDWYSVVFEFIVAVYAYYVFLTGNNAFASCFCNGVCCVFCYITAAF